MATPEMLVTTTQEAQAPIRDELLIFQELARSHAELELMALGIGIVAITAAANAAENANNN